MKRRRKMWAVLGPKNGAFAAYYLRIDALAEAARLGDINQSLRVVPATLEYDTAKKEAR